MNGYKFFFCCFVFVFMSRNKQVQPEENCADFPLTLSLVPSSMIRMSGKSRVWGPWTRFFSVWLYLINLGFDNSISDPRSLELGVENRKLNTTHKNTVFLSCKRVVFKLCGIHSKEYTLHHCTEVHKCHKFQETIALTTCSALCIFFLLN